MKVLVFCQRKKSLDIDKDNVDYIVNSLESFIKENYTYLLNEKSIPTIEFEYLTNGLHGKEDLYEADHPILFDVYNNCEIIQNNTIKFINDHTNYYDMIILQTCPLLLVKKQLPYLFETLKMDGITLFTNFTSKSAYKTNVLSNKDIDVFIADILIHSFTKNERETERENYVEFIYKTPLKKHYLDYYFIN
jgi:hypothetical protein